MIVALADTHRTSDHGLEGRTLEAAQQAEIVVHAGDFTTISVLEAFRTDLADFRAVFGNNDEQLVTQQLPAQLCIEYRGVRLVVVHGHEHSETGLALLGGEVEAPIVIFGHSHRPSITQTTHSTLVNPGSHAEPRQYRPSHLEMAVEEGVIRGQLVEPEGEVIERFKLTGA